MLAQRLKEVRILPEFTSADSYFKHARTNKPMLDENDNFNATVTNKTAGVRFQRYAKQRRI